MSDKPKIPLDPKNIIDNLYDKKQRIAVVATVFIDIDGNICFSRSSMTRAQRSVVREQILRLFDATSFGQGVK
jgi:hypothetical protein